MNTYTRLYIKQVTNKDLLYNTGNSTQLSVIILMRKESEKEWRQEWQPSSVFLLENPMDRGTWQATVHEVGKSQTPLND